MQHFEVVLNNCVSFRVYELGKVAFIVFLSRR